MVRPGQKYRHQNQCGLCLRLVESEAESFDGFKSLAVSVAQLKLDALSHHIPNLGASSLFSKVIAFGFK